MASGPGEITMAVQAAHIKQNPDPKYDLNPSTSASLKTPVQPTGSTTSPSSPDDIPLSLLDEPPRKQTLPPLPDLRFEQSYLASVAHCTSWRGVAWTTFVNHLVLPLTQGMVYSLAVFGWRAWNTGAKFHGRGVGVRVRRWWWGVNNWEIPETGK